jgi:hypothetical protein
MNTFIIIWSIILGICIYEAIWCTKLDPESEKFLKEREKNKKNGNKSTS